MIHSEMTGAELHDAYQYVQESDPGAVGAGKNWLQVSTGQVKRRNALNTDWIVTSASKFTQLTDVPTSYSGQTGKFLRVKSDETGLEFASGGGGGGISWVTPPTAENSTGTLGDLAYDGSGIYLATATNFWTFAPIVPFPGARGTYTFVSSGDTNGVFYALGYYAGGGTWTNPVTAGILDITCNNGFGSGSGVTIVDRSASDTYSNNTSGSAFKIDLGIGRALVANKYSYRARSASGSFPVAWVLEGSNNGITWTTLDTQGSISVSSSSWLNTTVTGSTAYRYFQLRLTAVDSSGFNYFTIGELELYGTFR